MNGGYNLAPFLKEEEKGDFSSCQSEIFTAAAHGNCHRSESLILYSGKILKLVQDDMMRAAVR